jgi:hypothetical protein
MKKDPKESWEKFLNPQTLRQNLVLAAVFLAAYEMLMDAFTEQLRGFYSHNWTVENGWEVDHAYKEKVLSLDKKEIVACAKWFKNSGAINDEDLALLKVIADHRNLVAHELPTLLGSADKEVSHVYLRGIYFLTTKVDQWWIKNIEAPTNPEFDERYPTEEELAKSFSLRMVTMSLLIQLAEGDDSTLSNLYTEWKKRTTP